MPEDVRLAFRMFVKKDRHGDSTLTLINSQGLCFPTQDMHGIKLVNILASRGEELMSP